MGKVNIDFEPTLYSGTDRPDLVNGAYSQTMNDLKTALDNATSEDGGGIETPVSIPNGGTGATDADTALENLGAASKTDLANYLPLTGGVMTGNISLKGNINANGNINVDGFDDVKSIGVSYGKETVTYAKMTAEAQGGGFYLYKNSDLQNFMAMDANNTYFYKPLTLESIADAILDGRKTIELTINIVDNEGEIDGHQIPKSEGAIIPLCVHGKHTATPVVFGFDLDEDDTNYLLYIYAQTKSQVDSINVVFEYLVL